jgi:hypothetical protein
MEYIMQDIIESVALCINYFEHLAGYDHESARSQLALMDMLLIQGHSLEEVLEDLTW